MNRVEGKVAIVTGAAGGLGTAITRVLSAEGATVVGLDVAEAPADASAYHQVDIRDELAVARAFANVVTQHGRIDVLGTTPASRGRPSRRTR